MSPRLGAQAVNSGPAPGPDVIVFVNGEKLTGQLQRATGSSVVFKSDMAGEITVEWSRIQELRSPQKFAAISKDPKLSRAKDAAGVPRGTVAVNAQKLEITTENQAAPQTIATSSLAELVPDPEFERAFHRTGIARGWTGGATAGLSLTQATQNNQTVTGAVNLVRAVPAQNWLDARSRTLFTFNESYGKLTQPGSPPLKSSLFHAAFEQDWYLRPGLFVFGQAGFDHNFSQGLDLQQTYGAGFGFVVFKTASQELDLKASVDYISQQFQSAGQDNHLIGSIFSETYIQKFARGILLNEQGSITPAWSNTSAYSAVGSAALTLPVYHHLGVTLSALDNFLNDPPPGFRKNSFQFTLGATYSFPSAR